MNWRDWALGALALALAVSVAFGVMAYRELDDAQSLSRVTARDAVALICQVAVDPEQPLATEPNVSGKAVTPDTEQAVFDAYINRKPITLSTECEKARRVAKVNDSQ